MKSATGWPARARARAETAAGVAFGQNADDFGPCGHDQMVNPLSTHQLPGV